MNLLITGAWTDAKLNMDAIKQMGHNVCFLQFEKDSLPCPYEWVEGVICNGLFLHHSIELFSNLKYIQVTSAGVDRLPLEYIGKHGIRLNAAKGVYSIPMAEFVFAGVLSLFKQMRSFQKNQENRIWEKQRGMIELFGKSVCIIGCGSIGFECARRFQAFGCVVTGVTAHPRPQQYYNKTVGLDRLDQELLSSDIIILSLPLTESTRHLMNKERLSMLRKNAIIVNVSRGAVMDTEAFISCAPNIGGAVLDVFEHEPLEEDSPLWNMENVILTPHNSFVGDGNSERLSDLILRNLME